VKRLAERDVDTIVFGHDPPWRDDANGVLRELAARAARGRRPDAVIHTPGHTPGSVCLYGARDRILFVGDNLQRRFGRVSFASRLYSDDYAMARRSVKRLAELDVKTVVFSHFAALEEGAAETLARLAREVG